MIRKFISKKMGFILLFGGVRDKNLFHYLCYEGKKINRLLLSRVYAIFHTSANSNETNIRIDGNSIYYLPL